MFFKSKKRTKPQRSLRTHNTPSSNAFTCEPLEPRLLLSGTSFVVTTLTDISDPTDNLISLREAITAANTNAPYNQAPAGSSTETDIITFAPSLFTTSPATLNLTAGELAITDSLTILGPTSNTLTIDANGLSRIFSITSPQTQAQISYLTLTGGAAREGGAIHLENATLTLTHSTLTANKAIGSSQNNGGAIYNNSGTIKIINSNITRNQAAGTYGYGGAIYNRNYGTIKITNSAVTANHATYIGGGIKSYSGFITLTNSTLAGNSADASIGGIDTSGSINLNNSIVTLNFAPLISSRIIAINSLVTGDPGFIQNPAPGPDAQWGTPDDILGDYHLSNTSPAINTGDNSLAVLPNTNQPLTTDLDNFPRFNNGFVDLGAYEFQGSTSPLRQAPSTHVTTNADTLNSTDNAISLREAIMYTNILNQPNITFAPQLANQTITLSGSGLTLFHEINIDASPINALTIDANQLSRVFYNYSTASLTNLNITGGFGGILNYGTLTINNSTIHNNHATGSGGGIRNQNRLTLINTTVSHNTTSGSGGGISSNSWAVNLINSTVTANSAQLDGGGIYNGFQAMNLINSTITNNSAIRNGGGIYNRADHYDEKVVNLINSTVAANNAQGEGGGIYNYRSQSNITLTNSIVALNQAPVSAEFYGQFDNTNTLIGANPHFVRNPTPGLDNIWATPDDDLGDLHLTSISPAINSGANAAAIDADAQPLTRDLDNNPRIADSQVDLGAYEFQNVLSPQRETPSTLVTTLIDNLDPTDQLISIREAIAYQGLLNQAVTFAPQLANQTITLNGSSLTLYSNTTIDASSINSITIDANQQSRVLTIPGASIVSLTALNITGGSFTGALPGKFYGGGIFNDKYANLTLKQTTVIDNISNYGGGIYNSAYATTTLINSTIARNSSIYSGGGINSGQSATLNITNSTLQANASRGHPIGYSRTGFGGAIYAISGTVNISNSTITANQAPNHSGGIYKSSGDITLNNTILALNFRDSNPAITGNANLISIDPLFIRNPSPGPDGIWATPDDDLGDLRLMPISPAINTGSNALLPTDTFDLDNDLDTAELLPVDINNNPRIHNTTVDIGAYEAPDFILGDLNGDESIDLEDVDLLSLGINTASSQPAYDLNSDGATTPEDGHHLIQDILNSFPADFNLDHQVDVADLSTWATGFGQTSALYSQGDANFDGQIDVADLSLWATNFGKTSTLPAPLTQSSNSGGAPLTQSSAAVTDNYILDTTTPANPNQPDRFFTPGASTPGFDRWSKIKNLLNPTTALNQKLDIIKNIYSL